MPQWQAVADDTVKGVLGTAKGLRTENEAKNVALDDCRTKGGSACKILGTVGNACMALSVGSMNYFIDGGQSTAEAESKSMTTCADKEPTCRVLYSACSLPVYKFAMAL
ncbi:DUF4189 domain-containing protein, partial [Luteibacter yeojuensis]|uniref:DUF4189 domain-containing protein n=1 Tax=Luteibacter yeojuensis TaxID=345309 RepID=UPI0018DDF7D4